MAGIKNGALLQFAEEHFDVLITSDQNLKYQQNLATRQLAIIQLPTNQVPLVIKLSPKISEALSVLEAGEFIEVPLSEDK